MQSIDNIGILGILRNVTAPLGYLTFPMAFEACQPINKDTLADVLHSLSCQGKIKVTEYADDIIYKFKLMQ